MRLIIRGKCSSLIKTEVRFAAQWAAHELLGKRLSNNITTYINFRDLGPKEYGSCIPIMKDVVSYRTFKIEITTTSRRSTQLDTLFHEMGHLKQFARQELDYSDVENIHVWRRSYLIDEREYSYEELPWEKEAFRIQARLHNKYNAHLEENHLSFLDI